MFNEKPVVWVVDNSLNKTIKDVLRFGEPEHIFTDIDKTNTDLTDHARDVLRSYREGDYICLIGDPKLSCICVAVIAQNYPGEEIKFLQWDSRSYRYEPFYLTI
jgi:hypothetical protein